jgi:hypothetical protein
VIAKMQEYPEPEIREGRDKIGKTRGTNDYVQGRSSAGGKFMNKIKICAVSKIGVNK